jgi:hypothetical protein
VALSEYIEYNCASRQIAKFLDEVYRRKRIRSSLGYLTPAEFGLEHNWRDQQLSRLLSRLPGRLLLP